MELRRNIKEKDSNKFTFIIAGIIFLIMGIWMYFDKNDSMRGINSIDLIYVVALGVVGIYFLIRGLKKSETNAFVLVNKDIISLKPNSASREKSIQWQHVEFIKKIGSSYTFQLKDQSIFTVHFSYYPADIATDLKQAIDMIAAQKNIETK